MAVTVGQTIGEAEYTTLRSGINLVMGTPTGTGTAAAGYNQTTTTAPAVSPGDKITAANWDALRSDVTKAYTHQVGSAPTLTNVGVSTGITKAIHDQLETVVNFVKNANNRFSMASNQKTLVSLSYFPDGTQDWNGTLIHDVNLVWPNANTAKAFFNAGGNIGMNTSLGYSGDEAKTLDWQSIVEDAGPIVLGANGVTRPGLQTGGTLVSDGFYDLDSTERNILSDTGTNPYSENDYQIKVRAITNGIRIRMYYRDDDAGDPVEVGDGGTDGLYGTLGDGTDENVKGKLYTVIDCYHPSGTVDVVPPTVSYGSTNTFT